MSKVKLALISFLLGACSVWLMYQGIQPVALAQGAPAQETIGANRTQAVPVVPLANIKLLGGTFNGLRFQLDGTVFDGNVFNNVTFTYAGGTFGFNNCTFVGNTRVELAGTAANTWALIRFFQALPSGHPVPQHEKNNPIHITAAMPDKIVRVSGNLTSPYGEIKIPESPVIKVQ